MQDVAAALARAGGVASVDELVRAGFTPRSIQRAAATGAIIRIRRGWYALRSAPAEQTRAIRVGGSLACISGCSYYGLWRPLEKRLHVGVDHGAHHLKDPIAGTPLGAEHPPPGLVVHWSRERTADHVPGVLPLITCLAQVVRCQPEDIAFAVLESALRGRHLSAQQQARLEFAVSSKKRFLVRHARESADSGSESLFRYRMLRLGVRMRSQVEIPGVGRVDFVIGDRLLIEIDSNAHHGGIAKRLRDLHRDAIAAGLGFLTLRFDYDQILHDWETVEATVLAIISRGEHLSARR